MHHTTTVQGLPCALLLSAADIHQRLQELAAAITTHYTNTSPLLLPVLNGAFVFAADLIRLLPIECDINFIQAKSYIGMQRTEQTTLPLTPSTPIEGRDLLIIEDIVDTGHTVQHLLYHLSQQHPQSITICTLLLKPDALQYPQLPLQFVGFQIPNRFVIGYGLDYQGYGRNLPHLYHVVD